MAQRVGLATAILAEPDVLMLDEPSNGLDPQSIQWLREFLRAYAHAGHTVFVSSHLLPEMQLMADHVVVIGRGTVLADQSVADFVDRSASSQVLVRVADTATGAECGHPRRARGGVGGAGRGAGDGGVDGAGGPPGARDRAAGPRAGRPERLLEQAFIDLTRDAQEYTGGEVA